jgi:hypothetical protein
MANQTRTDCVHAVLPAHAVLPTHVHTSVGLVVHFPNSVGPRQARLQCKPQGTGHTQARGNELAAAGAGLARVP